MQGPLRKVVQALLYEAIAVAVLSPAIAFFYGKGLAHAGALSLMLSASALLWNVVYNYLFEFWESRQVSRTRTVGRRLLHSIGFEGGLVLLLVPLVAWWLQISWWAALVTDLGLFVFFFFYALVFQWVFDRVFDLPLSAQAEAPVDACSGS
ncbi:PACE efflux transporter [Pseudomonas guariconensis]|uniref:PACE efflux transporter n=1 Tax=Pseudomonas guariconensis TaxID=1288410 RepID=UPI0018AC123D|nr:PACE efflux transporter [Pseudomonas guariconensis]MBF8753635.1 PACE efflux transporter [Pseudomonas guariconensis]